MESDCQCCPKRRPHDLRGEGLETDCYFGHHCTFQLPAGAVSIFGGGDEQFKSAIKRRDSDEVLKQSIFFRISFEVFKSFSDRGA